MAGIPRILVATALLGVIGIAGTQFATTRRNAAGGSTAQSPLKETTNFTAAVSLGPDKS